MTWRNKKFQKKISQYRGITEKIGSTHKPTDNLVVPVTISLDRPFLDFKLMSLN
jgi:hypothetical protein